MILRLTCLTGSLVGAIAFPGFSVLAAEVPTYTIHRTDAPITIDGRLDEPDWRAAPSVGAFQFPWWTKGEKEQTQARLLWDDKHLYVSYVCEDAYIWGDHTEHDSQVYRDDCVEVFTAPNPDQPFNYFNIEMNVRGAFLDRHHPDGPSSELLYNWNSKGIKIGISINGTLNDDSDTDRSWILEAAIPFANFSKVAKHTPPQPADTWHLNLNRLGGKTNPQHSQWSPGETDRPAFHRPEFFGRVVFSSETAASLASKPIDFKPIINFLELPPHIKLGACSGVAVNSKGHIHLFHRGQHPILCFDSDGRFLHSWGDGLIGKAHGLRIDRDDNVWVTDVGHHLVLKFDPTGKLLLALGQSDRPGDGIDQFDRPTDIAFGSQGVFYISDGYGNSRVLKFTAEGKLIKSWGTPGKGPGEFNLPHTIVVDAQGRVLVGDRENDRIQVFGPDGDLIEIWPGFAPFGIAIDKHGGIFVADGRANQILRLNAKGHVTQRWGGKGTAPGQFNLPHLLSVDRQDNVYVAEVAGGRLQKLQRR
ncbi:MAG: hypothetical protein IIC50_06405 [Planctomycetes bacterium]|nr:hypothetical protein [Planctomycetota bacterium]